MSDPCLPSEWLARANRLATVAALLSTTIHEVNNALQVISGSAEMLRPDTLSDVLVRRSDAIGGQARRGSALLAELSTFARDDTSDSRRADVGQIGQRALAMRQYALARLGIESAFEAHGPLRLTAARPQSVLQVVVNLLLNAECALTGRGPARIALTARQCQDRVELTVDDNGPGLSPDVKAHLFQPKIGQSPSALGIGLTVSKWLAERDGGTLEHRESALGGCAFTLTLPASREAL
jgi:two-component system C4-dicarboxylate transport sensor histidine kinase DctB